MAAVPGGEGKGPSMRIEIDEDKCTMAGQCVLAAPNVFDQREDGVAVLLDPDPPETEQAAVEDAIIRCPAVAIWLAAE
jgi:ferredoxin